MLTEAHLRQIMPNLAAAKRAAFLPHLNRAMTEYGINTMQRAAAFVAQLAHESGEFRWMEEIWGPTSAQRRYEPETTLSVRLGNTETGDGKRFKGRGPIQLTGRANYRRFGKLLNIDLVADPAKAATPEVGFRTAALYWANRGLNELADVEDFREITRRINGGFNGLPERTRYFQRAKAVLATGFVTPEPSNAPGRARAPTPAARIPAEPLSRGFEAIRELTTPVQRAPTKKKPPAKRKTTRKTAAKKTTRAPAKKKQRAPARKAAAKSAARRKVSTTRKTTRTRTATKKPAKKK